MSSGLVTSFSGGDDEGLVPFLVPLTGLVTSFSGGDDKGLVPFLVPLTGLVASFSGGPMFSSLQAIPVVRRSRSD